MDFSFQSSIGYNAPKLLVVSYDIACQWSRDLRGRCRLYKEFGLPDPFVNRQLRYV